MDNNEEQNADIFDQASTCINLFQSRIAGSSGDLDDSSHLDEQYRRFTRWAGYLGVLAAPQISLDKRLQDLPDIRDWVLELLELLKVNLNHSLDARSGVHGATDAQRIPSESDSSENALLTRVASEGIQESVDRLHWLGHMIRKSSTSQLGSRVSKFARKQGGEEETAEHMTLLIVKGLYPSITDAFCKLLARSISFRRQRLLYQKNRQKILEKPREDTPPAVHEPALTSREEHLTTAAAEPQSAALARPGETVTERTKPVGSITSTEKASTVNPDQLKANLEKQTQEGLSAGTQTVTSVTHSSPYPKAPEWSETQSHCQCDWCFRDIPYTRKKEEWPSAWKSHFKKDLLPDICISEDCAQQIKYFTSVRDWRGHMDTEHSPGWTKEVFKQIMWEHLKKVHGEEFGDDEKDIMVSCNILPKSRGSSECPLCGQDGTAEESTPAAPTEQLRKSSYKGGSQQGTESRKTLRIQPPPEHIDSDMEDNNEPIRQALGDGNVTQREAQYDESVRHLKLTNHIALHLKSLAFTSLRYFDDESISVQSGEAALDAQRSNEGGENHDDHYFELDGSLTFEDLGPRHQDDSLEDSGQELDQLSRDIKPTMFGPTKFNPTMFNPTMFDLEDTVLKAMKRNCLSTGDFLPCDRLEAFVTRENVTDIIDGATNTHTSNREDLVKFALTDGKRLFLILVLVANNYDELCSLLGDLLSQKISDKLLPIDFRIDETKQGSYYYGTTAEGNEQKRFDFFHLWERHHRDLFDLYQWKVLAPIFGDGVFYFNLHPKTILPYLGQEAPSTSSGIFGEVSKVEIHKAHVPNLVADPTTDRVAVAIKKAWNDDQLAEFFDKEARNLHALREYESPHLIKPIAAYQMNQDRCLIFPWANGGNLKHYWERFQDKRSDRESLQWILGQFKGLFSALQELHESNCRHGGLKPENILWFQDEHNLGTFQITDIGLAKLHEKEKSTKARKSFETVAPWLIMSRYETPEMDPTREDPDARSRQYDMWSMGCVTLELLIWIVYGYGAVKTFIKSTDRFWVAGSRPVDAPPSPYRVHPYVVSCMQVMMTQLDDQSALKDLLGLVEKRLLVVDVLEEYGSSPAHREIAAVFCSQMAQIEQKCQSTPSYVTPINLPYPSDKIRAQQSLISTRSGGLEAPLRPDAPSRPVLQPPPSDDKDLPDQVIVRRESGDIDTGLASPLDDT